MSRRLAALVVMVAQLALGLAVSAESWGGSDASPHVERHGTQLHHAHNEATCPACAAQSMHARVEPPLPPLPDAENGVPATVARADSRPPARTRTANGSRAPPTLS